jgi:hypothetical protein
MHYFRRLSILLLAAVPLVASATGVVVPTAAKAAGYSITLSAGKTQETNGKDVDIAAFSNPAPSPYWIQIFDHTTGTRINFCRQTPCTVSVNNQNGTHEYVAYISQYSYTEPPPDIQAESNHVSITWSAADPTQPAKDAAKQVTSQVAPLVDPIVKQAQDAANEIIKLLPKPDPSLVGDTNRMGTDGYVVQLIQENAYYFSLQVLKADTGNPVALNLPDTPKTWVTDRAVSLYAYDLGQSVQQAVRLNIKWKYVARSRALMMQVLSGQTHDGFVKVSVPVVGYPAQCGTQVPNVSNNCNGNAEGYYNPLKDSRLVDLLDAVPYRTQVQS